VCEGGHPRRGRSNFYHHPEGRRRVQMILALKIVLGIVLGVVILNVAFWAFIILTYFIVTLFECIGKWINK
jgi:hypothetical protein